MMFKKLAQKLNLEKKKHSSAAINPLDVDFEGRKSVFLDKLTRTAVNMYERKCDIKNCNKFTWHFCDNAVPHIERNKKGRAGDYDDSGVL